MLIFKMTMDIAEPEWKNDHRSVKLSNSQPAAVIILHRPLVLVHI